MSEVTSRSQQIAVRRFLGIFPILMVRRSNPIDPNGTWGWGRWRFAETMDEVVVNSVLRSFWRV